MRKEDVAKIAACGNEGAGATINETVDSVAKGPAKNGINGNVVVKGDGKVGWGCVRKCVREDVHDNGVEEAMEIGWGEVVGILDSGGEANGFEGLSGIIKFNVEVDAS